MKYRDLMMVWLSDKKDKLLTDTPFSLLEQFADYLDLLKDKDECGSADDESVAKDQ